MPARVKGPQVANIISEPYTTAHNVSLVWHQRVDYYILIVLNFHMKGTLV